jgi:DNA-binding NtrC family response regulator
VPAPAARAQVTVAAVADPKLQDSTLTSMSVGERATAASPTGRPQLILLALSDEPQAASSRHLLDDVDEVRFGRGPRAVERAPGGRRVLELRVPDRRMSSNHGKLVRGPSGWVLDDPDSKNGAVVDGAITRQALVGDGAIIELGHTFFVFRHGPVEDAAALDSDDSMLRPGPLATYEGLLATRLQTLERVAPAEISVLLQGETGTGKELVARALHVASGRTGAFVAVNCGALPAHLVEAELFGHRRGAFTGAVGERLGLVRSADQGTLFLDEVGELPAASQAAFLRVLQEREVVPVGLDHPVKVDVRLCAATLRDLEALVENGQFRRDLYARLFGLTVELLPLRERRVDLGLLIRRLLARLPGGRELRLTPPALRSLVRYHWPLNIRELEKVLGTAAALTTDGTIDLGQLPETLRRGRVDAGPAAPRAAEPGGDPSDAADAAHAQADAPHAPFRPGRQTSDAELRERLISLLTVSDGNVVAVARELGVRRTQVYRWLGRLKIDADLFRPRNRT